ncbi:MAG: zinc dependent phospholipase C family protein [Treponema sp.]|nr:zinc dependent phospholipase C family protein [Treponema sp.]
MPSCILHTLFGEDVFAELSKHPKILFLATNKFAKTLQTHKNVFTLGCQGPDVFYHSRRKRPVGIEYGSLLHRRGFGDFAAKLLAMSLSPAAETSTVGVYALGFATHAFLDRAAHPFIVYKTFHPSPAKDDHLHPAQAHVFFERIIDTLMLKVLRGGEISNWNEAGALESLCLNPPPDLAELLKDALVHTFPQRAGKDEKLTRRVQNTFEDSAGFYRFLTLSNNARKNPRADFEPDKCRLLYTHPENLPEHIDFLNLKRQVWLHPAGGKSEDTRSFPEIYAQAVQTAADVLSAVLQRYCEDGVFPVEQAVAAIGNGGLSIVDKSGAPCPPVHFDPLPLRDVLEQQFALYCERATLEA